MVNVAGIDMYVGSRISAVESIVSHAVERNALHVHLCNAYTIALAADQPEYLAEFRNGSLNLADGKPLQLYMQHLVSDPSPELIRGTDLFRETVRAGRTAGLRHFLLGSTEEVLWRLEKRLLEVAPGAVVSGRHSPGFGDASNEDLEAEIHGIRSAETDIVWVGLGTPKQDRRVRQLAVEGGFVAVAVGAAFDFISGNRPEAPEWVRGSGLEWAYRLMTEHRRLGRRYAYGNVRFISVLGSEVWDSRFGSGTPRVH